MDHAVDCLSLLQEKSGRNRASSQFEHGSLGLKYRLDNEFELVFVAAYQVGKLVSTIPGYFFGHLFLLGNI